MNPDAFLPALQAAFDDFPRSQAPRDPRYAEVHAQIPNLATPNTLALLGVAASLLEGGEEYVEVGSYRGASAVSALLGNDARAVTIDRFGFRASTPEHLRTNLRRFGVADRVRVFEGDAFELLESDAMAETRVGVYYYDAAHDYDSQLNALRLIEPYLAPRALLIVDDSDWEEVEHAVRTYLATQPRAKTLLVIEGSSRGLPWWWEGMHVLRWDAA